MKKIIILSGLLLLASQSMFAQEIKDDDDDIKTVFGDDIKFGGFGAYEMRMSPVANDLGLFIGGRMGWIINHQFALGGSGYGLTTRPKVEATINDTLRDLEVGMGYGGLFMEYTLYSNKAIHLSFPCMLSAGGASVTYKERDVTGYMINDEIESSSFFLIEPGVDLELNILKFFRLGFGMSYRLVAGTDMFYVSNKDLSDMSFNLTFKLGYF